MSRSLITLTALALALTSIASSASATVGDGQTNIVVVAIYDDVSRDMIGVYGGNNGGTSTPQLDALAAQGVRFDHAVASPVCSAFRATLFTGLDVFDTGIVKSISYGATPSDLPGHEMMPNEYTLVEAIQSAGAEAYYFGKAHTTRSWESGTSGVPGPWPEHLSFLDAMGFDGGGVTTVKNMSGGWPLSPLGPSGYNHSSWVGCEQDGQCTWYHDANPTAPNDVTQYSAAVQGDRAIQEIQRLKGLPGEHDAVIFLAFSTAHSPMIPGPPDSLVPARAPKATLACENIDAQTNSSPCFQYHVEATDTVMGSVAAALALDSVTGTDTVLVIADNGTPAQVTHGYQGDCDPGRSKATVYPCGVEVPLVIAGKGVSTGGVSDQVVQTADIYATLMAVLGSNETTPRSHSFYGCLSDQSLGCSTRTMAATGYGLGNGDRPFPPDGWSTSVGTIQFGAYGWFNGEYWFLREFYPGQPDPFDRDVLDTDCRGPQLFCETQLFNLSSEYHTENSVLGVNLWDDPGSMPTNVHLVFEQLRGEIYDASMPSSLCGVRPCQVPTGSPHRLLPLALSLLVASSAVLLGRRRGWI